MNCFNYEFNFNKNTGFLEIYIDVLKNNNFDPLKLEKYFTNFIDLDDTKEIIFVKKIQPKKEGYYLTLCKNECIVDRYTKRNQTLSNDFLFRSNNNLKKLKNQRYKNFSSTFDDHVKLRNDKIKKYKLLKIIPKELKRSEWDEVSKDVKVAIFKNLVNDLEKHLKETENNTKTFKVKNVISVIKINSTQINLPPISDMDKNTSNNPNRLLLLFEQEYKLQNTINISNTNKTFNMDLFRKKHKIFQIINLTTSTPPNENFFYFQTRQNGLKIKILPENSNEASEITTSTLPTTQKFQRNNDGTLTVENLPLNLLMKILQENKNKDVVTTTTPEPKGKILKDEVLNLQKQLLLVLLKEKEEGKSKESLLSSISKETLVKLLSDTGEKTTTTTTPKPTTKQHVILEIPQEVLQLLLDTNKNIRQESTKKDNDSKEKEKNDEKISLSAVTLLKLLTANLNNQSKEKNKKDNDKDDSTAKSIPISTTTSLIKVYKTTNTVKSENKKSDEDSNEEYSDEIESTTKKVSLKRGKSRVTTKKPNSYEYEESSEEKIKVKTTIRPRSRKLSPKAHNEDNDEYYDNIETKRSTKKTGRTVASVTISTSSEETSLTTKSPRKSTRKPKRKNKQSTVSHERKNKKRMNRFKGILESINGNQFFMNLIPRLKETFGIEPQVHPVERKFNRTLDN
uniref:NET domain-containing protein n=1 Tax=Strongyloides papillosus TaxID=174720 RepID=A0A0N5BBY8_STREA